MRSSPESTGSRREFFRSGARYSVLAGLAALTGLAGLRARRLAGQKCVNRGICSSCAVFDGCGLPQALSAKQAQGS